MHPELEQVVRDYPAHIVLGLLVATGVAVVQVAGLYRTRTDREYKLALLERGLSVADVERLTTGAARRRTVFEQFAALSGGAKAGVIIGTVLVANMIMAATIALNVGGGTHVQVYDTRSDRGPPRPPVVPVPGPVVTPMPPAAVDEAPTGEDGGC